ncbi:MAG: winged helix-turn-helix domain-containing protein [Candidatus Omnitrophica bacterium]|nr:winged helix-turn-helix domain-containing protein [Candidatus Omnitrophota bacterium]
MPVEYQVIGKAAGKIYRVLEQNGKKSTSELQKKSGISDTALFHQAIGWLAREGKLELQKNGRTFQVSLATSGVC